MNKKSKAIFIPADCIVIGNSRSSAIGKALCTQYDIYWFKWKDSRDFEWTNQKLGFKKKIGIYFQNLFRRISIQKKSNCNHVTFSFLHDNFFRIFFTKVLAVQICSWYNSIALRRVIKIVQPDHIFYMDGFYYFRAIESKRHIIWMDIQDDFDFADLHSLDRRLFRNYMRAQLRFSQKNYTVSTSAAENMNKEFNYPFHELPNGAWFDSIQSVTHQDVDKLKYQLGVENKIILTYIGGSVWYDPFFVKQLMTSLLPFNEYVLVAVGNLPFIDLPNIIHIGAVSNEATYAFFQLSDIGLLMKDSMNSVFLKNSQPLKIIQYAAAKKPVVTFPITWVIDNDFKNVFTVNQSSVEDWKEVIFSLKTFTWSPEMNEKWEEYDWNQIASTYLTIN